MNICISTLCALLTLTLLSGCGNPPPRTQDQILNNPQSKTEAAQLMREIDKQGAALDWSQDELKQMRSQIRGRLMVCGLSDSEINNWINNGIIPKDEKQTTKGGSCKTPKIGSESRRYNS